MVRPNSMGSDSGAGKAGKPDLGGDRVREGLAEGLGLELEAVGFRLSRRRSPRLLSSLSAGNPLVQGGWFFAEREFILELVTQSIIERTT